MKESNSEGLATHTGPKSCGVICEGDVEVLTGGCAGRVFSRESRLLRGADAVGESGRPPSARRYREMRRAPARSETPCTYGHTSHENREIPGLPATKAVAGRVGKFKDARRR